MADILKRITWKGCQEWLKAHPDEDEYDELGENPGACWVGACYILDTLGLPFRDGKSQPPAYKTEFEVDSLTTVRGWVHCYATCEDEVHYFSLYIETEEKATLVQVYGTLTKKEINLKNWINSYKNGEWKKLFNIPKNAPVSDRANKIEISRL
jgi:hypothetical protein